MGKQSFKTDTHFRLEEVAMNARETMKSESTFEFISRTLIACIPNERKVALWVTC